MVLPVHPSALLAMDAVWHFVLHGTPLPCPVDLAEELKEKLAAFVSIKNGDILRGCILPATRSPRKSFISPARPPAAIRAFNPWASGNFPPSPYRWT